MCFSYQFNNDNFISLIYYHFHFILEGDIFMKKKLLSGILASAMSVMLLPDAVVQALAAIQIQHLNLIVEML